MAHEGGPEGRLLYSSDSQRVLALSPVLRRVLSVSVHMPSIWPVVHSLGLCQDLETSHNLAQKTGSEASGLHRPLSGHGRVPGISEGPHHLGFIVHSEKSVATPSQELEFLEMAIHSQTMELRLPSKKVKKIRAEAMKVRRAITPPTACEVSCLLGKLNSLF